jgi:spore coat protein U-like protein
MTRRMTQRLALISALLLSAELHAATTTGTFSVTATVQDACSVVAGNLAFGTYDPASTSALNGSSTIDVTCTLNNTYEIQLNQGTHGGSVSNRQMSNGTQTLNYALYRDSSRTQNWGSTNGTDTVGSVGTGASQPFTVYGQIAALQYVPQGSYSDVVTVTIDF